MVALAAVPGLAFAAAPPLLWQVPVTGPASGSGAGGVSNPRAVAVDPTSGDVFVSEKGTERIDEFTAWGEFVKGFGWKVNAAAPAEELQVCTAETGCQTGTSGAGRGQLAVPAGLAVGEEGRIYVADEGRGNNRIQAFEPDGSFAFMSGGQVNRSAVEESATRSSEENLCPAPGHPADVCQAGVAGAGPGEFSNQQLGGYFPGDYIASGPGDTIYVGDVGRIEKFDADGNFIGEIKSSVLAGKNVKALDVDAAGDSYVVAWKGAPEPSPTSTVLKLGPAGEELMSFTAPKLLNNFPARVEAVAVGPTGNVYMTRGDVSNVSVQTAWRVIEFDAAGNKVLPTVEEEEAEEAEEEPFPFAQLLLGQEGFEILGLTASRACGQEADDIFVSYFRQDIDIGRNRSLLRAYGPHPDPALCPPPSVPPSIEDTFTASVGPDGATVRARINPHFLGGTTYYVQYGTGECSEGGCSAERPTAPGSALGSEGGVGVEASVFLSGLTSGTTYHYRFVTQGSGGGPVTGPELTFTTLPPLLPSKADCPNQPFRIGLAASLPDCRAYEMVSPVDKEGADVVTVNALVTEVPARLDQSAASGERLTYSAYRAFANPKSAPLSSQYLSSRGAAGWSTEAISPPRGNPLESVLETGDVEYEVFSADLCQGWLRLGFEAEPQLDPAEIHGFPNLYRRGNCAPGPGAYRALTTVPPPQGTPSQSFNPQVQGVSADGRCAVFRAPAPLTPEAPVLPNGALESILYEDCGGALRLVAILPDGTPIQSSSTAGVGNSAEANSQFQQRGPGVYRAVSEDGTKIYWTSPGQFTGKLYLRINADQPQSAVASEKCTEPEKACTLAVSDLVSSGGARFWTASADGTRAFFSVGDKLYEYTATNPKKPKATLVAEGVESPRGMLGASEDAARLYFASKDVLAANAVAGEANLYFLERGQSPRFLGVLDPSDLDHHGTEESIAISVAPGFRAARVSPDGLYAAFMSSAPLTGFDNTDQRNGASDREVFLYDAAAAGGQGRLVCVSCDPSGARPVGDNVANNKTAPPIWAAARIPTWPSALYASNALIAGGSGASLFFDSFVALVPHDTNGKADVYEWQSAESQAACEAAGAERYVASSHGCLSLISSGQSPKDSEFIDANPSGRDVFFATGQSLLSQDPGLIDIYDARQGGGFPPPAGRPAACEGEACQSPPEAPNDPTPASSAFVGAGNVHEAKHRKRRCAKGKVRRKGRCIKKHHRRGRHKAAGRSHSHKRSHR